MGFSWPSVSSVSLLCLLGTRSAISSSSSQYPTPSPCMCRLLSTVSWHGSLGSHTGQNSHLKRGNIPLYSVLIGSPRLEYSRYAWTSVFATEMLTAATIVQYWEPSFILSSVLFYIVTPLFLVFINSLRVSVIIQSPFYTNVDSIGYIRSISDISHRLDFRLARNVWRNSQSLTHAGTNNYHLPRGRYR